LVFSFTGEIQNQTQIWFSQISFRVRRPMA
jgi:hypothetical protein